MTKHFHLAKFAKDIKKCSRCGLCQAACPVYNISKQEADGPRGKVILAEAILGHIMQPAESVNSFSRCLLCGQCERICPSKIPLTKIFFAARFDLTKYLPISLQKKQFFIALANSPKLLDFLQAPLSLLKKFVPQKINHHNKFYKLISNLPAISQTPFYIDEISKEQKAKSTKGAVLLFAGCISRRIYPDIARSCLNILAGSGFDVIAPAELGCCGRPLAIQGLRKNFLRTIIKNLEILKKYDFQWLVTPCSACLATIKNLWGDFNLLNKEEDKEYSKKLANKSVDINDFTVTVLKPADQKTGISKSPQKMAFFHPCLMENTTEINARYLCSFNNEIIDIQQTGECCGLPLACFKDRNREYFSFTSPDSQADKIARKKNIFTLESLQNSICRHSRDQIAALTATRIVTTCPGCKMAFEKAFAQNMDKISIYHSTEVYWEYLQKDEMEK